MSEDKSIERAETAPLVVPLITKEQIRQYICPNATDQELVLFAELCKREALDPFRKQAFLIKYGDGPASMVVAWQVFLERAQLNPRYRAHDAGLLGEDGKSCPITTAWEKVAGAWGEVYLHSPDGKIRVEVVRAEYERFEKGGQPTRSWKTMPKTMLRKVALSQALRESYPAKLTGLYTAEEMGHREDEEGNIAREESKSSPASMPRANNPQPNEVSPGICPAHKVPFRHITKKRDGTPCDFWACSSPPENGVYCKIKPSEEQMAQFKAAQEKPAELSADEVDERIAQLLTRARELGEETTIGEEFAKTLAGKRKWIEFTEKHLAKLEQEAAAAKSGDPWLNE